MTSEHKIHKILIIGPAWIGDMVMAQALFKTLKLHQPEVIVDVLAPAWSQGLLSRMPQVRRALVLPFKHGELNLRGRYRLARALREQCYDQAIVLPNSFKSALIPFWAKIPLRTGWRGELRWGLLNDMRYLDKARFPLMVQRFAALGILNNTYLPIDPPFPALQISTDQVNKTLEKQQLILSGRPVLALCPGAEYGEAKRWPPEYFAKVANAKLKQGWEVWILGSSKEQAIAREIQVHTQGACIDLVGRTDLGEAIDLLSVVKAVITNDSGLMHVAAALDKALVVIYGSSSAQFTPPLAKKTQILSLNLSCSPCFQRQCPLSHLRCLRDLMPQQILAALDELLMQNECEY